MLPNTKEKKGMKNLQKRRNKRKMDKQFKFKINKSPLKIP